MASDNIESTKDVVQNVGRNAASNVPTPCRGGRAKDANSTDKTKGPASALEELMRKKGVDEAWTALEEMQKQGTTTDKYTVSRMLMKTVGDGRSRLNPTRIYRSISLVETFIEMQPKDVDEVLFNALLDTCCRLKDLNRMESILNRMQELQVTPSPVTLGILVKTYGQAGDLPKVLHVWDTMEKQRGQANAVTFGCMIDACVKCGHLEKAVEIFKEMRQSGKHRNTILYTTLIKGHGLEKDLEGAMQLFREMPDEGVPYNTITYNSILDACVKCGDLAQAEALLRELLTDGNTLAPDVITFSTMIKGYCNVGNIDKALQVAEAIKSRGLRADELVYNTLMDGCVRANDIGAGVGLFEEMIQNGMRPSAITHSILARLYQRAGYEDDAAEAVAQLYQQHGIDRPDTSNRGKGNGRRGGQRSPNGGKGGDRSVTSSPVASPAHSMSSYGGFSQIPAMPGFDGRSVASSPPGTPLTSSPHMQAGPHQGFQMPFVPPMPGASQASPTGSGNAMFFVSNPCGTPQNCMDHNFGFGMQQMHAGMMSMQQGAAPQMPPWPLQCANGMASPPANVASGADFGMHQMMQAACPAPPPPCQVPGMCADMVSASAGYAANMQLPMAQPQQQVYFEGWGPSPQIGFPMQTSGGARAPDGTPLGGDGSSISQAQFLS